MLILKAVLAVIANLIIYLAFGSFFTYYRTGNKGKNADPAGDGAGFLADNGGGRLIMTMAVGFFAYYSLFAIVTLPIMLTYRPLSLLTGIWTPVVTAVVLLAIILKGRLVAADFSQIFSCVRLLPVITAVIAVLIILQAAVIVMSYDFTLDAAYYVANVTTSVDTNMINVYDPFTGAWQDHYELRYAFATYSVNDAVVCQLTHLPALVVTKTVMTSTVVIMVNLVYLGIAVFFFGRNGKKILIMMLAVCWINFTFITIYTASNFLVTRTYEGKAIVGNLALVLIFWMYIELVRGGTIKNYWLMLFAVCFGSTTITSSANMLIPAQVSVLFVPYIIKHKEYKLILKYMLMMLPGIIMLLEYVLYVKGYFVVHTYPR